MLPLIVDTTASDVAQLVERMSVIRDHGYDIMMVYKKSSMDVSMQRAAQRARYVDPVYIKRMNDTEEFRIYELEKYIKAKGNKFILLEPDRLINFLPLLLKTQLGLKQKRN
jgi:hypothetical protein